ISRVVRYATGNIARGDGGVSATGTRAVASRSHGHECQSRMTAEAKTREFIKLVNDGAMSQAACAAAELGIADLLASGPKRADELARATGCHAASLHRLLRALASLDLCAERAAGAFALTAS